MILEQLILVAVLVQITPNEMRVANQYRIEPMPAHEWLNHSAGVISPELETDEELALTKALKNTQDQISQRLSNSDFDDIKDIQFRFFGDGWSIQYVDYDSPLNTGPHPIREAVSKRQRLENEVNEFRQWELAQVEQLLDDLPSETETKVRLALERCRLVQFGLPNYIRWMAADGEIQWTEEQLIQLQDQLRRNESQMQESLKFEAAEFDRKFLQRLPAAARQTLQRRLGFSLDQLPAWRRTMKWNTFNDLWLPFERSHANRAEEAYRNLRYLLDHQVTSPSVFPFSIRFMELVPVSQVNQEYGMSRYSPSDIETAIRDHIMKLQSFVNSAAAKDMDKPENYRAMIELMEQWLRNEPVNDLDDWDRLYKTTTNYHDEFLHIGELTDVRGKTAVKHLSDSPGSLHYSIYQMPSIIRWASLPQAALGSFERELDLTDAQRIRLSQFWFKKRELGQMKWDERRAMFPELQKELETVLTPQQTVIGFQCVVAGWGPFPILMHPDAAEDYGLSPEDRVALKSFAQTERARIEQNQLASVRRSYQTIIANLEPKTRQLLCDKVGLDPATLSLALAECNAPVNANRFPQRYYWFDEFYDQGRVCPPLEDTKTRSRKTLIKYGWVDEANKEP